MAFTKQELQKIKDHLTPEAKIELADNFKLSLGSIKNILGGRAHNDDVIIAALAMALKIKAEKEAQINEAKKSIAAL